MHLLNLFIWTLLTWWLFFQNLTTSLRSLLLSDGKVPPTWSETVKSSQTESCRAEFESQIYLLTAARSWERLLIVLKLFLHLLIREYSWSLNGAGLGASTLQEVANLRRIYSQLLAPLAGGPAGCRVLPRASTNHRSCSFAVFTIEKFHISVDLCSSKPCCSRISCNALENFLTEVLSRNTGQ